MKSVYYLIFFILLLLPDLLLCQNPNPSYQLNIRTGGNVDFKVVAMDQYKNGGLEYLSWTTLEIYYSDTLPGQQEWKVGFRVEEPDFESGYAGNFPDHYISIEVEDNSYGDLDDSSTTLNLDRMPLSTNWQSIAEGVKEGHYQFDLHYRLDSSLINRGPGYFTNILIFDIAPQGGSYDY
jgi:hypothetical protein